MIESISYLDEFDNKVKIVFKNQKQNKKINMSTFRAKYSLEFDVISDQEIICTCLACANEKS